METLFIPLSISYPNKHRYFFSSNSKTDITIVSTPAYAAARIIGDVNPVSCPSPGANSLCPIAVVGLGFDTMLLEKKRMVSGF